MLTWRELNEKINAMTEDEKDKDVNVFSFTDGELCYGIGFEKSPPTKEEVYKELSLSSHCREFNQGQHLDEYYILVNHPTRV